MFDDQLAWFVAGPVLGACVVVARLLFGGRLGVTGGFGEVVAKVARGSSSFDWRGWFAIGVLLAGVLYVVLHGGPAFDGYGWLTRTFDGASGNVAILAILAVSGFLIGWGAKVAGGCTSGNGLSGTSMLSAASFTATATFFGVAIVVSFAIEALT